MNRQNQNDSYGKTLNLPKTKFLMKANLAKREQEILDFWNNSRLYQELHIRRKNSELFLIHDGPPYANGAIHLGHAVNKTLKDIILKTKLLDNYRIEFVPGWDCHGLPIEIEVEKKRNIRNQEEFRSFCHQHAKEQIEIQKSQFIRLGILADWERSYQTFDSDYIASTIKLFARVYQGGHVKHGFKPVHWCCSCRSALAEAEVEYRDQKTKAIDLLFYLTSTEGLGKIFQDRKISEPIAIPVWTTTPWTLPANAAVAVNPELNYNLTEVVLPKIGRIIIIIAEELEKETFTKYQITQSKRLAKCKGQELQGLFLFHPFEEREVPLVTSTHVTADRGTGAVHIAPNHGLEDYLVGKNFNLPKISLIDKRGYFHENTTLVAGLHFQEAAEKIISILEDRKKLILQTDSLHSYPHCWRHRKPLIFLATPQWFISMDKNGLREKILASIDEVKWENKWGHDLMKKMIEKRPDWCISRQRTWGIPIPLFLNKENLQPHPESYRIMIAVAEKIRLNGVNAWWQGSPEDFLGSEGKQYEKCDHILDVWLESAASATFLKDFRTESPLPFDLVVEGCDQFRGWFNSALTLHSAVIGKAPYQRVLTHGFVVDKDGDKLSKSRGNALRPEAIIKVHGADILRLWVAGSDFREEVAISDESLKRVIEGYRKIRNTLRFMLANISDYNDESDAISLAKLLPLDRLLIDSAAQLQNKIKLLYGKSKFHIAVQEITRYCNLELSGFYFEILKDRLYTCPARSHPRRSAQTALMIILEAFTKLIAPILSFTAEEVWKELHGDQADSIFFTVWSTRLKEQPSTSRFNAQFWGRMREIRLLVNAKIEEARQVEIIRSSLEAEIVISLDKEDFSLLSKIKKELKFFFLVSEVHLSQINSESNLDRIEPSIVVRASLLGKCNRCWHYVLKGEEKICDRCRINLTEEKGEKREFI